MPRPKSRPAARRHHRKVAPTKRGAARRHASMRRPKSSAADETKLDPSDEYYSDYSDEPDAKSPVHVNGHLKVCCKRQLSDIDGEWIAIPTPGRSDTIQDLLNTVCERMKMPFVELRTEDKNCILHPADIAYDILGGEPDLVAVASGPVSRKPQEIRVKDEAKLEPLDEPYSYYSDESDAESPVQNVDQASCLDGLPAHVARARPTSPVRTGSKPCSIPRSSVENSMQPFAPHEFQAHGESADTTSHVIAMPKDLAGRPFEFFWIRVGDRPSKWAPCVVYKKKQPVADLCSMNAAEYLYRHYVPVEGKMVVEESPSALEAAMRVAHEQLKEHNLPHFCASTEVNGSIAVSLGGTRKERKQALKLSCAVLAVIKGEPIIDWAPAEFRRLIDVARDARTACFEPALTMAKPTAKKSSSVAIAGQPKPGVLAKAVATTFQPPPPPPPPPPRPRPRAPAPPPPPPPRPVASAGANPSGILKAKSKAKTMTQRKLETNDEDDDDWGGEWGRDGARQAQEAEHTAEQLEADKWQGYSSSTTKRKWWETEDTASAENTRDHASNRQKTGRDQWQAEKVERAWSWRI